MSATEASRHYQSHRKDLRQLTALHSSDSQTDTAIDVVPPIVKRRVQAQRLISLVTAVVITLILVWAFAHEKVGVPSGLAYVEVPTDAANAIQLPAALRSPA